eukprot:4621438-Prymnesium_polylepis.1
MARICSAIEPSKPKGSCGIRATSPRIATCRLLTLFFQLSDEKKKKKNGGPGQVTSSSQAVRARGAA